MPSASDGLCPAHARRHAPGRPADDAAGHRVKALGSGGGRGGEWAVEDTRGELPAKSAHNQSAAIKWQASWFRHGQNRRVSLRIQPTSSPSLPRYLPPSHPSPVGRVRPPAALPL
eukprot:1715739-Rhodomonas_salina.1